jgi:hypothetical protein
VIILPRNVLSQKFAMGLVAPTVFFFFFWLLDKKFFGVDIGEMHISGVSFNYLCMGA